MRHQSLGLGGGLWAGLAAFVAFALAAESPLPLGARRELFIDYYLIDKLTGATLTLHEPRDEGAVLKFDRPWEGAFSAYCTVLRDGDKFRLYYRGSPSAGADGSATESTCYAESTDGRAWTKPSLGLFEVRGSRDNNVILANAAPLSHNFCPMLDARAGVPAEQRYKALAGTSRSGLVAFVSNDGVHWSKLREPAVITEGAFDSQNVPMWSEAEQRYVCYFRTFKDGIRRISRTTSADFVNWTQPELMEYRHGDSPAPIEHTYTNQTHPYFRAPHIYVSIAARFMPGRQVLTDNQARELGVNAGYFKDTSDAIFMTTRGGNTYDRTFLSSFIRPGLGLQNWVSRTNYPALNVVPTGPNEMSVYVNQDYAQPTAHLRRYAMRLDGFASVRAPYEGGEVITKPLTFDGKRLLLNFATSAAGGVRVEIQDERGVALPGFTLAEARELIGNEIERAVSWQRGDNVSALAGKVVRLRLAMKDADVYGLQFAP